LKKKSREQLRQRRTTSDENIEMQRLEMKSKKVRKAFKNEIKVASKNVLFPQMSGDTWNQSSQYGHVAIIEES